MPGPQKGKIIGLVGEARAGKTTLMDAVLPQFPQVLRRIKSVTTRAPRNEADHESYDFITREQFEEEWGRGEIYERVEHAGNLYGVRKRHLESILAEHNGIMALVEDGVREFKELGYPVVTIRVVPQDYDPSQDPHAYMKEERRAADEARAKERMVCDHTIENSFLPGGKHAAITALARIVAAC